MSDLWWIPSESGWGLEIVHEQDAMFLMLYLYDADSKAHWYSATSMTPTSTSGTYVFAGELDEFNGPYFGGVFTASSVSHRKVGTVTVNLSIGSGTVTYSIDGVTVTKAIQRFAFKTGNLSGSYYGAAIGSATGCGSNSGSFENVASFTVSQSGANVAIAANLANAGSCSYSGAYTQEGRMGRIDNGSMTCSTGVRAAFNAFEIEAGYQGLFLRYNADYGGGCTESGRIGGIKR